MKKEIKIEYTKGYLFDEGEPLNKESESYFNKMAEDFVKKIDYVFTGILPYIDGECENITDKRALPKLEDNK